MPLSITVWPTSNSRGSFRQEKRRRRWWGLCYKEILEIHSFKLLLTHSSLNRCFGNWILSLLNVSKMLTLTKQPPPLSFSDLTFYCYSLKAYTAISLLLQHHMAPAPSLPQFWGGVREMHNQCNIHELKNYCTYCFFFFFLFCVCTFSTPSHLIYLFNM